MFLSEIVLIAGGTQISIEVWTRVLSLQECGTLSGYGYRLQSFHGQLPSCGSTYSLWFLPGPSWDGPWHAPTHSCQAQHLCCVLEKNLDWHYPRLWPCIDFFALGRAPTTPQNTFGRTAVLIAIPASKLSQPEELARVLNSTSPRFAYSFRSRHLQELLVE